MSKPYLFKIFIFIFLLEIFLPQSIFYIDVQASEYSIDIDIPLLRYFKCFRLISTRVPSQSEVDSFIADAYGKSEHERNNLAAQKCINLLESASFSGNSEVGYQLSEQTPDNIAIVRNFQNLHRSWLLNASSTDTYAPFGSIDVHESAESALRYTLALFGVSANISYESILGNTGGIEGAVEGIRTGGIYTPSPETHNAGSPNFNFFTALPDDEDDEYDGYRDRAIYSRYFFRRYAVTEYLDESGATRYKFDPDGKKFIDLPWTHDPANTPFTHGAQKCPSEGSCDIYDYLGSIDEAPDDLGCNPKTPGFFLEYGDLIGVKPTINCEIGYQNIRAATGDSNLYSDQDKKTFNIKHHFGGGVLGSFDYWANNNTSVSDRGYKPYVKHMANADFARRWARHVLSDFLCRELPILDSSIVNEDVSNDDIFGDHTYLADGACMACHSTIDRMSAAVRNIQSWDMAKAQAFNFEMDEVYGGVATTGMLTEYKYENCYKKEGSGFSNLNDLKITPSELCNKKIDVSKTNCQYGAYDEFGALSINDCGCKNSDGSFLPKNECSFSKFFNLDDLSGNCSNENEVLKYCFPKSSEYRNEWCKYDTFPVWKDTKMNKIDFNGDGLVPDEVKPTEQVLNRLMRNIENLSDSEMREIFGELQCVTDLWKSGYLGQLTYSTYNYFLNLDEHDHYPSVYPSTEGGRSAIWPQDSRKQAFNRFNRSIPKGGLWIKDINNQEVKKSFIGVEGLANAMKETPDFYACAVKKYFNFFTGSEIPLFYPDRSSTSGPLLSMMEIDVQKMEWIIDKGNKFHKNEIQNLHEVIREIIKSDYFMESIIGVDYDLSQQSVQLVENNIVNEFHQNLKNCASCHNSKDDKPTYPSILVVDVPGESEKWDFNTPNTCLDKLKYLKALVGENTNACDNQLFLSLESSKDACDNNGFELEWMNLKVEIDQDLVRTMIEDINDLDTSICDGVD